MKLPNYIRDKVIEEVKLANQLTTREYARRRGISSTLALRLRKIEHWYKLRASKVEQILNTDIMGWVWSTQLLLKTVIESEQLTDQHLQAIGIDPKAVYRFLNSTDPRVSDWAQADMVISMVAHINRNREVES